MLCYVLGDFVPSWWCAVRQISCYLLCVFVLAANAVQTVEEFLRCDDPLGVRLLFGRKILQNHARYLVGHCARIRILWIVTASGAHRVMNNENVHFRCSNERGAAHIVLARIDGRVALYVVRWLPTVGICESRVLDALFLNSVRGNADVKIVAAPLALALSPR